MDVHEKFKHAGCRVKIYPDDHPESPREWDNLGTMVCWHTRYNLGDEQMPMHEVTERVAQLNREQALILPLYLYDHSGITMNTTGFSCPWDSGQVGFIYATREKLRDEYGVRRVTQATREDASRILRAEVKIYDQFITGDVWGYVVRDKKSGEEDSCWGFFGLDACREEAKMAAEAMQRHRTGQLGEQHELLLVCAL